MFGALGFFVAEVWVWVLFLMKWGKKLEVTQLITPSYQSNWAPSGRAALLSLLFLMTQV